MRGKINKKFILITVIAGIIGIIGYNIFIKKDANLQNLSELVRKDASSAAITPQQQSMPSINSQQSINDDDSFLETVNQEKKKQILAKLKSETIKYSLDEKESNKKLNAFDLGTIISGHGDTPKGNELKTATEVISHDVSSVIKKERPAVALLAINYSARNATLLVNSRPIMAGEGSIVENMLVKEIRKDAVVMMEGEQENTLYVSWGNQGKKNSGNELSQAGIIK